MTRPITGALPASILNRVRNQILLCAAAFAVAVGSAPLGAQTISFTSVPEGYEARSITLPDEFAGALGVDPKNDRIIYSAVGSFGAMSLARLNLQTGESAVVAAGPFGAIGGIAPLSAREIVVTDNSAAAGGPPDETILILRDFNPRDGDFNDSGEIRELIAPILGPAQGNWNGSQARVVPKRRGSRLKPGSVMIQTADGGGGGEMLVIEDLSRRPRFAAGGVPFFSGFDYNGGFDFDSAGRVIMGTLTGGFTGEVFALADLNGNRVIDAGESNRMVAGENGVSDLAVDSEDDVFFTGYDAGFAAAVRTFPIPADPLAGGVAPVDFAATDAGFLSGLLINSKRRPFEPGTGPFGASLILGGFTGSFEASANLLVLTPADNGVFADAPFAVEPWPADSY